MIVVGVDGCPDGWIAATLNTKSRSLNFSVHTTFAELLITHANAQAIGVDIPIGLPFTKSRQADIEARKLLGKRKSSVFPAPSPAIRHERNYRMAVEISNGLVGKGISRQAFAILPKIAEVNDLLLPEWQNRIFEVHPEVSFYALNGNEPMATRKADPAGFEARRNLLLKNPGFESVPERETVSMKFLLHRVNPDDMLDAVVAAWTAQRVGNDQACRVPKNSEYGFRGLKAEIVY